MKMNVNEIMIGNHVNAITGVKESKYAECIVTGILGDGITLHYEDDRFKFININQVKPIMLTAEWMQKFDFWRSHTLGHLEYSHDALREFTFGFYKNEVCVKYGNGLLTIKTVHHLQNFFHIFGKELKIAKH